MLNAAGLRAAAALAILIGGQSGPVRAAPPAPTMVTVVHRAAYYPWIATSRSASAAVEADLLRRCTVVMGAGCNLVFRQTSGAVALARREDGTAWYGSDASPAEAQRKAMAACRANNIEWLQLDCEIEAVYPVRAAGKVPRIEGQGNPALTRGRFGTIAFFRKPNGDLHLSVAAGRTSAEFSNGDALANCQSEAGSPCQLFRWGTNVHFLVYTAGGKIHVNQGRTLAEATARQEAFCRAKALRCKVEFGVNSMVEETSEYTVAF